MASSRTPRRRTPSRTPREPAPATIVLDPQCTLREAEALKIALKSAEDSSGDFVFDGAAVERVDTAGLQLLAAFTGRLRVLDRTLAWKAASPALRQGAAQLGLTAVLGL